MIDSKIDFNAAQKQLGLNRADMARAMGVHYYTLAKWQRVGHPDYQKPPAAAVTLVRLLLWVHKLGMLPAWQAVMGKTKETSDDPD